VAAHAPGRGRRGDLRHRVDDAVCVGRRGRDDQHGVRPDRRRGGGRVGAQVRPDRHDVQRHPQVVGGLGERGVRGGRHHQPRAAQVGPGVAGGLDRQDERLGAAAGYRADRVAVPAEQLRRCADQRVLHGQQGREGGRVQAVDVRGDPVRGVRQLVEARHGRVVDVCEQPPAVRGQVRGPQLTQLGQHLPGRHAVVRQPLDHRPTVSS
jgi:hypothetical protein